MKGKRNFNSNNNGSLNIFQTEGNAYSSNQVASSFTTTNANYSKGKYLSHFNSDIFFKDNIQANKLLDDKKYLVQAKVNTKQECNTEQAPFKPMYREYEMDSLQRKLVQLKGTGKEILTNKIKKSSSCDFQETEVPSTSLGFYRREQEIENKFLNTSNTKERYYANVSNSIVFNKSKRTKSMNGKEEEELKPILFTNSKISKLDETKVEYKNDSRQFLHDNIYSNKVFPKEVSKKKVRKVFLIKI